MFSDKVVHEYTETINHKFVPVLQHASMHSGASIGEDSTLVYIYDATQSSLSI